VSGKRAELSPAWVVPTPDRAKELARELKRELPLGHALSGARLFVLAFRADTPDDLLLQIGCSRGRFAVVHLTWRQEVDPQWPHVTFYKEVPGAESVPEPIATSIDERRPSSPAVGARHPWLVSLAIGALLAVIQSAAFPCNGMPLLSFAAGLVAGSALTGAVVCATRSRWLDAIVLGVIGIPAAIAAVLLHLCG
jgi:hypothetical protein